MAIGAAMTRFGRGSGVVGVTGVFIDRMSRGFAAAGRNISTTARQIETHALVVNKMSAALNVMGSLFLATAASAAGLGLAFATTGAMTAQFEKSLRNMNSVLRGTEQEMYTMGSAAVSLSTKYATSASNIAEGMYHLASAGFAQKEILDMLEPTIALTVATQGDYAKIAKDVAQVIRGFNLETTAAQEISDKFIITIQNSLVTWDKLGEGIKFAMPWFRAAGLSVDELIAAVGVLSDRALEAGIAGRGLRQSLAMLVRDIDDNSTAFADLGLSMKDATGNAKPLLQFITEVKDRFRELGLTGMEEIQIQMEMMGIRGATAFAHLVDAVDDYQGKLDILGESQGRAQEVAQLQMQSLSNQLAILKNTLMAPFLNQDFVESIGAVLEGLKEPIQVLSRSFAALMQMSSGPLERMGEVLHELTPMIQALMLSVGVLGQMFANMHPIILQLASHFMLLSKVSNMQNAIQQVGIAISAKQKMQTMALSRAEAKKTIATQRDILATEEQNLVDTINVDIKESQRNASMHYHAALVAESAEQKTNALATMQRHQVETSDLLMQKEATLATIARTEAEIAKNDAILISTSQQAIAMHQTRLMAQTQTLMNLTMFAGFGAIMAYGEGIEWLGHLMTLAAGVTGYFMGMKLQDMAITRAKAYLEKQHNNVLWEGVAAKLAHSAATPIIGIGMAAASMAMIYMIGQQMAQERRRMTERMKDYETLRPAQITVPTGIQAEYTAVPSFGAPPVPSVQTGGFVEGEGLAYVHAGETIVPAGEGTGHVVQFINQGTIIGMDDANRWLEEGIRKVEDRRERRLR